MDENEQKQQLSIDYLHAVASAAGFACQATAVVNEVLRSMKPATTPMPATLAEAFEPLRQHVTWLHIIYDEYRKLYGTSEERVKFLNEMAPGFFRVCQDALLDDVVLSICRLTDPAEQSGRENLTLERVADIIGQLGLQDLHQAVEKHRTKTNIQCKALREHRNKRIAHLDLRVAFDRSQLADISRQTIGEALASLWAFVATVVRHYEDAEWGFTNPIVGNAETVIFHLKKSEAYHRHQIAGRVNPFEDGIR